MPGLPSRARWRPGFDISMSGMRTFNPIWARLWYHYAVCRVPILGSKRNYMPMRRTLRSRQLEGKTNLRSCKNYVLCFLHVIIYQGRNHGPPAQFLRARKRHLCGGTSESNRNLKAVPAQRTLHVNMVIRYPPRPARRIQWVRDQAFAQKGRGHFLRRSNNKPPTTAAAPRIHQSGEGVMRRAVTVRRSGSSDVPAGRGPQLIGVPG